MTEPLDAKLARIGERVKERGANARERLAKNPPLLEFCEMARAKFGAKLIWLKDAEGEMGRKP